MKHALAMGSALVLLALVTGCGDNRLVGHRMTHRGTWQGELGVVGNVNQVHVRHGSKLTKLKIAGDLNKVIVEDRVPIARLEIWGENNTVSIPEYMRVVEAVVGKGNRIVRRARGATDYGVYFDESANGARGGGEMTPYETGPSGEDAHSGDSGEALPAPADSSPPAEAQPQANPESPGMIRTLPPGRE